jgi:hypothetical protein
VQKNPQRLRKHSRNRGLSTVFQVCAIQGFAAHQSSNPGHLEKHPVVLMSYFARIFMRTAPVITHVTNMETTHSAVQAFAMTCASARTTLHEANMC